MIFLQVLILTLTANHGSGLILTGLAVPNEAILGSTTRLVCGYKMGKQQLYSVKWYRNDYEYFRFMPKERPQTKVFPEQGISVDEKKSDMHTVVLTNITGKHTGTYKCEVSTEGPVFETVIGIANLTVVAFPDRDPVITLEKYIFSLEESISANCTSGKSFPATTLEWFINGIQAGSNCSVLKTFQVDREMFRSWSQIKFVGKGEPGDLLLSCVATISPSLPSIRSSVRISLGHTLKHSRRFMDSSQGVPFRMIHINSLIYSLIFIYVCR